MTSLNGCSEDNTLAEVGQPDGVSVAQKEEDSETMETIQDEVVPQLNGEKVEKESPDTNDISTVEEKAVEEKADDASEVGFKKIFRFVGFKFTLKKDKSEEKDPVKLLTVKDKEVEEINGTDEPAKKEEVTTVEEKSTDEEKEANTETSTAELEVAKAEKTDAQLEGPTTETTVKEEGAEKEGEPISPSQESTLSPFRKFFSGGLFSNLRKKTSIKKTKEEEDKDVAAEEETTKTVETTTVEEKEEKLEVEQETKEVAPVTREEEKCESKEETPATTEEEKLESKEETPATTEEEKSEPKGPEEAKSEAATALEVTVETPASTIDETKQEPEKAETCAEEEKAAVEVTSEAEQLSLQEKAKPQGSPLKKLFTGAGLKKLSTKKQKTKKDPETKLTESGEQAAEQLQSFTESTEAPKADSGPSSPEESGEHTITAEVTQTESSQEAEGEVPSDGEKKKEGIIAWSSFKKLVTPKKRVKRSSESDDEGTGEKPAKSATLSSSESAALADKSVEEPKEDKQAEEEPKTENNDKLVSSTEEPKKRMDTSVSWEALMCMGGPKKRTRQTSDSDDEETKIEEAAPAAVEGEQEVKGEAAVVTSQNTESEGEAASSPEPSGIPPERESAWDTLKRIVMSKNKAKAEEKPEESADQVQSDGETPKDESSFSLRKFFPGRRKKKAEKQASTEVGSGEEDSDTPAVVPLSEYEEQVQNEQEVPVEPAPIQIKVSAEDRSPSWIPATVETLDDKHDQLSDIPEEVETAATPKSVDTDIAADEIEELKINTILEPHAHDEAMATCTGLGTEEIAKVALEKPVIAVEECVVESDVADIQAEAESQKPQTEKVGVVSTVLEEPEVVQPTIMSEHSPNAVTVSPITATSEAAICTQSIEVTGPTVETKEVKMEIEQLAATEEYIAVQVVTEEVSSTVCEITKTTITKEMEPAIETAVPVTPLSVESDQATSPGVLVMEIASVSEPEQETKEEIVETLEAATIQTVELDTSAAVEQTSEKIEESKDDVQQTTVIEAQSIVIAKTVIQDAMDKVSEDTCEPKKPTSLTPVQAIATTEKEIALTTEAPVLTDTPVAVVCEKPAPQPPSIAMEVTETVPVDVTESLDASAEKEKKPEDELKQAVEVKVSEETVVMEEVVEIKPGSLADEEFKQSKTEKSEEDPQVQEPDVKEEVVAKADSPASENKLSTLPEAPQLTVSAEVVDPSQATEASASQPETENAAPSGKCAEVMAQVIEVIEEAVKEIEPASTEITAAS
nr:A-kinase anchor protein 12 isoform X2 [Monopterus albus]